MLAIEQTDRSKVVADQSAWFTNVWSGITTAAVGKWRTELTPRQIEVFETVAGDELRALGYETSGADGVAGARSGVRRARRRDARRELRPPAARAGARPGGAARAQAKARSMRIVKRVADPVLALVALVVLSPVFLAISLWIVVESGRPIFFVYPRAGKDGRPFRMVKFRTMVQDAIELGRSTGITRDPFGVVKDDPRITGAGRWLRRTSLDELPQLVNVLLGQMSLVGPRADLVEQAAHYTDEEARRLTVLPGITGWAQVHGRDSVTWQERFRMDLWYIDNWSLWLDVKIVFKTFGELFRGEPEPIEDELNIERAQAADE